MVSSARISQLATLQLVCLLAIVFAVSDSFAAPHLHQIDQAKVIDTKLVHQLEEITKYSSARIKELVRIANPEFKCRQFVSNVVDRARQLNLANDGEELVEFKKVLELISDRDNKQGDSPDSLSLRSFMGGCIRSTEVLQGAPTGRVEKLSRYFDDFARTH